MSESGRSRSRDRDEGRRGDERSSAPARREQTGGGGGSGDIKNLYISQLSDATSDESLRAAFASYGEIVEASVMRDPKTKEKRGFGFVCFQNLEDAEKAMSAMNSTELDGKTIRVEKAKRNRGHDPTPGQYLGPPHLSSKYGNSRGGGGGGGGRDRYDDRGGGGRDRYDDRDRGRDRHDDYRRDGSRDRGSYRDAPRDPYRDAPRDSYRDAPPRDYYRDAPRDSYSDRRY